MKALTLIPKKIKDIHLIQKTKDGLAIHKPAYVNIDFDEGFEIEKRENCIIISNKKCLVTLWRVGYGLHITIF